MLPHNGWGGAPSLWTQRRLWQVYCNTTKIDPLDGDKALCSLFKLDFQTHTDIEYKKKNEYLFLKQGTNYRKTNAAMEMRRINRDSFWARAEVLFTIYSSVTKQQHFICVVFSVWQREEEERKEEERKRAAEERRRLERERVLKERRDAEERDRKMNEKLRLIEEQR